jgi:hypothetical protein
VAGAMEATRKRKYQDDIIKSGFTSLVINGEERPQCVICCEVLAKYMNATSENKTWFSR